MTKPSDSDFECVVCGSLVTESNDCDEHVIPNSIGGRLKTRGFICADCNNKTGYSWDAELAQQMNPLCLFFGIVRERGAPPPQAFETTAGERLVVRPDGGLSLEHPIYKEQQSGSGIRFDMVARTRGEARKMLEGVKRNYPGMDIKTSVENLTVSSSYPKGAIRLDISFGGEMPGRSLVKTVAAFAHHSGISSKICHLAIMYLRDAAANACFGYYYEDELVAGRPSGTPFHCVAVSGNPATGLLLGYVEYFGVQRVVVCLSDTYEGAAFNRAYAIDPTKGREIDVSVRLPFSVTDVAAIYDYKKFPGGALQRAFSEVIPAALKKKFEKEKDRVISDAVEYAFANCGAKIGEVLTAEQTWKLSRLAAERVVPFILRNASSRRG